MISGDTTVARLLDEHPQLVEVLAEFHPHFRQLRNRLLRRVMGPRVTVAQAARIAGVPGEELLAVLRRAVGEGASVPAGAPGADADVPASRPRSLETGEDTAEATERPPALAGIPASRLVHLDVRDDIRQGVEPFARIMAAVKGLAPEQAFVLRTPFEPFPLYDVLGRRGLAHWTECRAGDDWSVWFYRDTERAPAQAPTGGSRPAPVEPTGSAARVPRTPSRVRTIDVRGLPPPQPMVSVLELLDDLGPDDALLVVHDRRPMFLYPQLDERGFAHDTSEPAPGRVEIRIRRVGPACAGPDP